MPICAPVGGRGGFAMNGHHAAAWSLVMRYWTTGVRAGLHPRPGRRWPRRGDGWNR